MTRSFIWVRMQFCLSHSQSLLILTECLLVLSNLRFLSFSWSWTVSHSCDFSIIEITQNQIVVLHSCDFLIACSCWDQHSICSWECLDILTLDALQWTRDEIVVFELFLDDLNVRNSVWIEVFDKLRLLFQSSWCSWSVVTAVDNRELEMIDACCLRCQWEIERLKSVAVRCELLVCEDDLLLSSFLWLFELELAL